MSRCTSDRPVLDYACAPVGPAVRYSGTVVFAFLLAIGLPMAVFYAGFARISEMPGWALLGIPLTVFAINFCSALDLLDEPNHVRGDGLICWGVFISGANSLIAMLFVMIERM